MDAWTGLTQSAVWPGHVLAGCLGAFLVGSVPFGLLLALWFGKTDVRRAGSGNIGATNVARVAGRRLGLATLALDAAKGFLPAYAARHVWPVPDADDDVVALFAGLVGLSALLGHCFTPWLRLRGGKGVATGLGTLLALSPVVAGYGLVAFAVAFAAARIVSVASLAAVVVVVLALILTGARAAAAAPMVASLLVVVVRHTDNVRRLARRAELAP
ncbi:MAG: glycerol-3-phosphate acyltransferase [Deltaproteobacteria bacterium]|nr:glycerol-3-phosphate acyltransferase [Deltaproteobacteria bacterium]